LYQDAIVLEAEILEIKPRMNSHTKQSYLQAIVDIGYIDTDNYTSSEIMLHNSIEIVFYYQFDNDLDYLNRSLNAYE
jgi:predicted amino acid racemase